MPLHPLIPSTVCLALGVLAALPAQASTHRERAAPDPVPKLVASLSLEEKVAQLVMSYPPLDGAAPVRVGAVIFVGPLLRSESRIREKAAELYRRAPIPPLIAVDMEGGRLNRLRVVRELRGVPSAKELGQGDERELYAWGKRIGRSMRKLGLNCNLGPVLDVAGRGLMHELGRSFGTDEERVARLGRAYARGLLSSGVVPIGKHFPGYGDLQQNSDHRLVITDRSGADISRHARVFFRAGEALGGVMLTNVGFTAYGSVPAIFSPELVSLAHLKSWMTVTDDLSIGTLSESTGGDQEEVVRRAFLAGNDLLLTTSPVDWEKGLQIQRIVQELVRARPELVQRVDASVTRILRVKQRIGLLDEVRLPPVAPGSVEAHLLQ